MTEIDPENLNIALNLYSKQVALSHMGLPSDPHHQSISYGMRSVLYALGVLDDNSNNVIVEEAMTKAEKSRRQVR